VIGGKYVLKKDQIIIILPWMLHRDTKAWGDDVESFKPERFDNQHFAKVPPNSWKPFGNGQRSCIGLSFALQEATLVMALLLQRFDIALHDPSYNLQIKESLTIKPDNFYITAKKRAPITVNKTQKQDDFGKESRGQCPWSKQNL
jgi:cytochrome P450 / NADPH-cytochrome P450 reductase